MYIVKDMEYVYPHRPGNVSYVALSSEAWSRSLQGKSKQVKSWGLHWVILMKGVSFRLSAFGPEPLTWDVRQLDGESGCGGGAISTPRRIARCRCGSSAEHSHLPVTLPCYMWTGRFLNGIEKTSIIDFWPWTQRVCSREDKQHFLRVELDWTCSNLPTESTGAISRCSASVGYGWSAEDKLHIKTDRKNPRRRWPRQAAAIRWMASCFKVSENPVNASIRVWYEFVQWIDINREDLLLHPSAMTPSDDAETIYYSRFHCRNALWKQSKTKPELYDVQVPSLTGRLIHNLECSPVNTPLWQFFFTAQVYL